MTPETERGGSDLQTGKARRPAEVRTVARGPHAPDGVAARGPSDGAETSWPGSTWPSGSNGVGGETI